MTVVRAPAELEPAERAVAVGTFDGVHRGHRRVIDALRETGLASQTNDAFRDRRSERVRAARLLDRGGCDRCWCRFVRHGDKRVPRVLRRGENVQKFA